MSVIIGFDNDNMPRIEEYECHNFALEVQRKKKKETEKQMHLLETNIKLQMLVQI